MIIRSSRRPSALTLVLSVLAGTLVAVTLRPPAAGASTPVLEKRVIGYSVRHRPIVAYHLGDPSIRTVSLISGEMHGDEHAGVTLVDSIVRGSVSVEGLNLWVVPTMNPDGDAAHTRQNAHHVDLNRNWPNNWAHLTGQYYSGPRALSEPETRAMYTFLRRVRPHYLVSLHQPLTGVDSTTGDGGLRTRLAHNLGLPIKAFNCWSVCRGSMTGWYTAHRYGIAETVEFGWHPSTYYLTGKARRGILAALGGRSGSLAAHNPLSSLTATTSGSTVRLTGWAFDTDSRAAHVVIALTRDGRLLRTARAGAPSAAISRRYHLVGGHGFVWSLATPQGRHTFCVTATNIGAGTRNTTHCRGATVAATA